jgi:uncharacterized protein (TIGR03437 family)
MASQNKFFITSFVGMVAIAPIVLYAIVPGPGYTGAPGDSPTGCITAGCHTGTPNSGTGFVKIVASGGLTYVPGQPQQIAVTIADSTEKKYGFQLSARVDSNPKTMGAGLLTPGKDAYTKASCADGSNAPAAGCNVRGGTLAWIEHTVAGYEASGATPGSFTFNFTWTPPANDVGTVTLYAAGNAVTGADVVTGTQTYLTSVQLSPAGPPAIAAVVNDAGFASPIASGSWVAIFGANLAPAGASRSWDSSTEIVNGKLPTGLDGTTVTVNGKPAVVNFISPAQVNIQTPDDSAVGLVPVVVTTATGGASATFMATYTQFAPGLFTGTTPYLAAQHAGGSDVLPASPARPGEVITIWGTGFGPANPNVPAGQVFTGANPLQTMPTATIGGQPARIQFAGVVGAGLVQFNVEVPAGAGDGDAAVVLSVAGVSTQGSNNFIAVHDL